MASLHNDTIPIARIPDDVYFRMLALLVEDSNDIQGARALSQVNRRWRFVAIDYPGLWSRIVVHPCIERVKMMLERSRDIPISIKYRLPFPSSADIHALVALHAHRARKVEINCEEYDPEEEEGVKSILRTIASWPALERLALNWVDTSYEWDDEEPAAPPMLRHLRMVDTIPSGRTRSVLIHPFLPNVTHFSFSCPDPRIACDLRWRSLFDLLRHMPLLESFAISDTDLVAAGNNPFGDKVPLPRLALFRADRVDVDYLLYVFPLLEFPPTTRFRFTHRGKSVPHLPGEVLEDMRCLTLSCVPAEDPTKQPVLFTAHPSATLPHPEGTAKTELLIPLALPAHCLRDIGNAIVPAVGPMRTLDIVDFSCLPSQKEVLRLSYRLALCETVRFTRCSSALMTAVFDQLGGGPAPNSNPRRPGPFPLATLEIRDTQFRERGWARAFASALDSMAACRQLKSLPPIRVTVSGSQLADGDTFEDLGDMKDMLKGVQ